MKSVLLGSTPRAFCVHSPTTRYLSNYKRSREPGTPLVKFP
jgi:hypothetical protein